MQRFLIIILIITFSCSQNKTDNRIAEFENVLGERQTNSLNLLVTDFENNLAKIYPNLPIEKGYRQYLVDMISDSISDYEKHKFQSDKTNTEFHQSGLWSEIYLRGPKEGLVINNIGKYIQALYAVKGSNSLIKRYSETREAAGMMPNELVLPGILSFDPDFNDYFHKRIVVVEFSF